MFDSEKFRGKYRVKSARLPGYDYSSDGAYFITICIKNKSHFLGEIKDDKIVLSDAGEVVAEEWIKTEYLRRNVILGEWVIMPNHFHGIVIIQNDHDDHVETPRRGVSTQRQYWKSGCLGAIINQFKSVCTKRIRKFFPEFEWQSRYHDCIIRDEDAFLRISEYIRYNLENWVEDDYY